MKADQRREMDSSTAARPASVKLTGFGEARIVGEKYRDGQSVILDMTDMSDADARRLVDFSAGLAFSLRGSIEKVAPKVFMLLPAEADIAGGAAHALEDARAYVGGYAGR
jgi:cell division inhibitor SepF